MQATTIFDDSKSNKEQKQELIQQLMDKKPVVETGEEKDDGDEDYEAMYADDQEDDYMPYISRETVDGYLVSIIGLWEQYCWPPHWNPGLWEEGIC